MKFQAENTGQRDKKCTVTDANTASLEARGSRTATASSGAEDVRARGFRALATFFL